MSRPRILSLAALATLLAGPSSVVPVDQTLIAPGSAWKYNDTGANLGTTWRAVSFDDTAWPAGPAQLGYGDGGEATVISYGGVSNNRYLTYYFRRAFTVAAPSSLASLLVRYVRDDGAVIYLNGVEVVRSNMPTGTLTYRSRAVSSISGANESAWSEAPIDPALLNPGNNVVAVEIHQQSVTSTDVSFDLELRGTEAQAPTPTVSLTSPPNGGVSNTPSVAFTAAVAAPAGLASAALFVGDPEQTVTLSGPLQAEDTQISADTPTVPAGSATSINVDGSPHTHGLLKFPALIGSGGGQVPLGAAITSAVLQVECTNTGNTMQLYRLIQDWTEGEATWNERSTGLAWGSPGADGPASHAGAGLAGACSAVGPRSIDVTPFVQEWSDGAPNYGIVLTDSGTDGVDLTSSEGLPAPTLTVVYRNPLAAVETRPLSGSSADVTFTAALEAGRSYRWNVQATDLEGRQSWAPSDFVVRVDAAAPNEPVLVSPADGATGVPTTTALSAVVSDPAGGALTTRVDLRVATAPEFTVIALPDTQHYSEAFPGIFTAQTQWIVDNKDARNIVFVTHEGDVVEHNTLALEWQRADTSMSLLDGVVPYGMGPGNHDQPTTLYNQYFPYTRYDGQPWYGGHYQNLNDNNFQLFSGGGLDFVIVHLEFCPPAAAVSWADSVFKAYPERVGIMTTHGYLGASAARSVNLCSSTQYLWDDLAVPNPNLRFMLCGHVHAESRRTDTVGGRTVFQMLADYQDRASGGEGWLRILRFVPADGKVYVQTFSPWLNRFETDADSEFSLDYPMGGAFAVVDSASVPSGATVTVNPTGLAPSTRYEWRVTVTNAQGGTRTGPVWTFTTAADGPVNQPPVAFDQAASTQEDTPTGLVLGATDPENDPLTYSIVSNPSHGSLSGSGSARTYQPQANYSGADSFTFRVSDGAATSNTATVSLTVQPVNDPPSAAGEAYTVASGGTLTVSAPGVLGNDTDLDGPTLTARLLSGPANGSLTLNANGSFSYVPAAGFSGADSFGYEAFDGTLAAAATVTLTVTPPAPPTTLFTAGFNSGTDSFTYVDNTFRGATQSAYASGTRTASGGFTGGALVVQLGGLNATPITGISGGWRRTFTLASAATVRLSFRYYLHQGSDYEADEVSQVLASLNGALVGGTPPGDSIVQITGDGDGGPALATGWQLFDGSVGTLPAGTHTLILGGYNSKKDALSEQTTILIDDVSVSTQP